MNMNRTDDTLINTTITIETDYPYLLTIEYYAYEELPAILSHLNLTNNNEDQNTNGNENSNDDGNDGNASGGGYHIIANSWGCSRLGILQSGELVGHGLPHQPSTG